MTDAPPFDEAATPTRRLAAAVLTLAVTDARTKGRALPAMFESRRVFAFWCAAAGLDVAAVREASAANAAPMTIGVTASHSQ